MHKFRFRILTEATPSKAWKVVGDIGGLDRWVPGVTECTLDGPVRTCTFADGRVQHETVVELDTSGRSYRYEVDGSEMGMTNTGAFRVTPAKKGSLIEWDADIAFKDSKLEAQMVPMLDEGYGAAAAALAAACSV